MDDLFWGKEVVDGRGVGLAFVTAFPGGWSEPLDGRLDVI
jgi:hypothetical protein